MKIVASNSLTVSNVNDGSITHTAWANSADGTDRFTTVYPNLNLLDGTKDFSGDWIQSWAWQNDGTYKGLTVKKRTAQWNGIFKTFTAPKDGSYTFSAYIKSSGDNANVVRIVKINGADYWDGGAYKVFGNNFDWLRDSYTITLKAGDTISARYEISSDRADSILWTAGHKWEEGLTATPYMQSSSEVTTADWPKYIGHYTDFTQADSTNPSDYTWGPMRGDDGKDGADGKDGIAGKDGVGIKNTVITYAISTSGTVAPTAGWNSQVPTLVKGQYLWTKTVWNYSDGTSESGYTVSYISKDGNNGKDGIDGKDGVGIKTTDITYAISTSGTTAPTSGWISSVPSLVKGQYLWTKTVWTYTDNSSETGYSVTYISKDGNNGNDGIAGKDGVGISNTVIDYVGSVSGTINPTSGWSVTIPKVPAGQYLWTRTTWQYTDGTTETGYAVAYMGTNGNNGANGTNGNDGTSVTITSKQILYQNSTSGTTAPTGTWSTTVPSTPQGQFRWARTIVNYSDGTSTQTDLVGYVGVDGQVGPQGNPTGITQQATEPSNKYAGMMWQYTGNSNITIDSTTIYPQVQYIYDGSKWIIYAINVANLNVQTLAAITANLGTVTAGVIKSYIDYTYYNNSATGIPAKAYLRIDANNVNQKIALQSPSGVDWGYIRQDVNGITIFADEKNAGTISNASGRYVSTNYGGAGISFINSNNASVNANGDLDVAMPYTGTGSLYFDGTNLISSAPIIALNTIVKSYSFTVGGLGVRLDRLMSQVMVTFSGQVTSAIAGTPTFNNQLPIGFCPINPASVDYMVVGNVNANGYIYFNPDGSIRFMANVPLGAYIRGTRSYITADAYPS